jgi:hypothetical protein
MRLILLSMVLVGMMCARSRGGELSRRHEGTRLLRSADGRLVVEVIDPANPPPEYHYRDRFTPSAFVTQAALDGKPFVYAGILHEPQSFLGGMPTEYDISERTLPPGYTEATAGEPFVKIGVGRLRKDDETYRFIKDYPDVEKPVTEVSWREDGATFRQVLTEPAQGYAYALETDLQIEETRLIHTTKLTNAGDKPFTTDQYLHNFLRFSNRELGPDYVLRFPFDIALGDKLNQPQPKENPVFVRSGPRELTFADPSSDIPLSGKAFIYDPAGKATSFVVEHRETGQRLTIESSKPFFNMGLWITEFQLSPEANVLLEVAPGETEILVRTYTFENR